jgi:hypothetical protein
MRTKGFVFILSMVALLSTLMLFALAYKTTAEHSFIQFTLGRKVSYAFDDVEEGIGKTAGLEVTREGDRVTVRDLVPANHDVMNALKGYGKFVQRYYMAPELEITFLSQDETPTSLEQLQPPLTMEPFGFNYTYPGGGGWGKRELGIEGPAENFSNLSSITAVLRVADMGFSQNFTGSCATDWENYKDCTGGTDYCLHLNLTIIDRNGSEYHSPCDTIDVGFLNKMKVNFANESSSGWMEFRAGQFPTVALNIRLSGVQVNSTITLGFTQGSMPFVGYAARMRVRDANWNYSKEKEI